MKKHPTKKEEKRIQKFLKDMQWAFGLQNWDRSLTFEKLDKENIACQIEIQEDYQRIQIYIYPCFFNYKLESQREYLLHEFCHYLTDPLANLAWKMSSGKLETDENRREAKEKSTSMMANILDKLLTDNMPFAKEAYREYLKK